MLNSEATSSQTPPTTKQSRQIIIGDVHGHFDGLLKLINAIEPQEEDELYFLGDLVDRGPKSAQVVDFVRSHGYPCLRGNHEELMIAACDPDNQDYAALHMWTSCGGRQTLESYDSKEQLHDDVAWLKTLPTFIDLGSLWLVHAGVDPRKKLEQQSAEEFCWIRSRFHKSSKPYFEDKLIVTGHTITFTLPQVKPGQIAQGNGWMSIDTGAYHPKSGWLTAYDATNANIFQVNVFKDKTRSLALEDAIATVNPKKIKVRF